MKTIFLLTLMSLLACFEIEIIREKEFHNDKLARYVYGVTDKIQSIRTVVINDTVYTGNKGLENKLTNVVKRDKKMAEIYCEVIFGNSIVIKSDDFGFNYVFSMDEFNGDDVSVNLDGNVLKIVVSKNNGTASIVRKIIHCGLREDG